MKKLLKDYKDRSLKNSEKIKGGGAGGPVEKDKIRRPVRGKH